MGITNSAHAHDRGLNVQLEAAIEAAMGLPDKYSSILEAEPAEMMCLTIPPKNSIAWTRCGRGVVKKGSERDGEGEAEKGDEDRLTHEENPVFERWAIGEVGRRYRSQNLPKLTTVQYSYRNPLLLCFLACDDYFSNFRMRWGRGIERYARTHAGQGEVACVGCVALRAWRHHLFVSYLEYVLLKIFPFVSSSLRSLNKITNCTKIKARDRNTSFHLSCAVCKRCNFGRFAPYITIPYTLCTRVLGHFFGGWGISRGSRGRIGLP